MEEVQPLYSNFSTKAKVLVGDIFYLLVDAYIDGNIRYSLKWLQCAQINLDP